LLTKDIADESFHLSKPFPDPTDIAARHAQWRVIVITFDTGVMQL
jgi:hypothetical protein